MAACTACTCSAACQLRLLLWLAGSRRGRAVLPQPHQPSLCPLRPQALRPLEDPLVFGNYVVDYVSAGPRQVSPINRPHAAASSGGPRHGAPTECAACSRVPLCNCSGQPRLRDQGAQPAGDGRWRLPLPRCRTAPPPAAASARGWASCSSARSCWRRACCSQTSSPTRWGGRMGTVQPLRGAAESLLRCPTCCHPA